VLRDERGITLVEVLATMVLLSIIGVTVWSVFFQGYSFSQKAISKNFMHQETNLLISNLTKIHQTAKQYELLNTASNCEVTVKITNKDNTTRTDIFTHPKMCFKFDITNTAVNPINPNLTDVQLLLTTSDKNIADNKITIDTFLYRIKGVKYQ
jgi:type II secretory pathway pseudopilin PulG